MSDTRSVRNTVACDICFWFLAKAEGPTCLHPQALQTIPNYLTGGSYQEYMTMTSMRAVGPCGPGGVLFEAESTARAKGERWPSTLTEEEKVG